MQRTRRLFALTVMIVVLMAVPASAASWRTAASVRGNGDARHLTGPFSYVTTTMRDVSQIRVGFHTYGSARTVSYDYEIYCIRPSGVVERKTRNGVRKATTGSGYQWVTIWDRDRRDLCEVAVKTTFAGSATSSVRTKVEVR